MENNFVTHLNVFDTSLLKPLYSIMGHTIQYDLDIKYSAEKSFCDRPYKIWLQSGLKYIMKYLKCKYISCKVDVIFY